jgi:hypothetical protein
MPGFEVVPSDLRSPFRQPIRAVPMVLGKRESCRGSCSGSRVRHSKSEHQHFSSIVPRRIAGFEDGFNCSASNASPDLFRSCFEADLLDKALLKLPHQHQARSIRSIETSCTECSCKGRSARRSSSCCLPCQWETSNPSSTSS